MMFIPLIASIFFKDKLKSQTDKPSLQGMRFQLYKTLKQMANGRPMLVCFKIPDLNKHIDDEVERNSFFDYVSKDDVWKDMSNIDQLIPVMVPGTWHDRTIGTLMIKQKWCEPCDIKHWIPNIKIYSLTEEGIASFNKASDWWHSLSVMQKLKAAVAE